MQKYDGLVLFDQVLIIRDDLDRIKPIWGLLYDKNKWHKDDLWTWKLNRFISYLHACDVVQHNNGKLSPGKWTTPDGMEICLTEEIKNFIYQTMKPRMTGYKIIECAEPFEISETETEDMYVISQEYILQKILPFIYHKTFIKNQK